MRKKHQAVHISTAAKKNFCNEISLSDYTSDIEIKERLSDYFDDNIKDEEVVNSDDNISSDDDSFEVGKMKVPKQIMDVDKGFAKFQISERAILSGIEDYNYELIPKKVINIGEDKKEKKEENNRDIGSTLKIDDIIKQYIFWKENSDDRNNNIEPFELFNLDKVKIKEIKNKINEIKKIAKDKKMNEPMLNKLLKELDTNYSQQRKEINYLASNMENINSISYGKNYSVVEYKK